MNKKFFITGIRRGLGEALKNRYGCVDSLEDCDIFINCKHDKFEQINLLYQAADLNKKIINIGSNSPDQDKHQPWPYAIQKAALDKANHQLFYQGVDTTIIRFGYFDSPRVSHIDAKKIDLQYCVDIVEWTLKQPYRVKEITITP